MDLPVLIALAIAVLGPLATYLVAARKLSGKISSSEASDLWNESRSIRQDLLKRNEFLREQIEKCDKRIAFLEDRIDSLEAHNEALGKENGELKKENEALKKSNTHLRRRVQELELRVKELEAHDLNGRSS